MTLKELQKVKESYREDANRCYASETPYAAITGICCYIATESRYNHHERGQRLWAFFQALKEEEKHNGTEE